MLVFQTNLAAFKIEKKKSIFNFAFKPTSPNEIIAVRNMWKTDVREKKNLGEESHPSLAFSLLVAPTRQRSKMS